MSGGSSETELKELIVTPIGSPSELNAVTMVTPVAKLPSALRKSRQHKPLVKRERPLSHVAQGRLAAAIDGAVLSAEVVVGVIGQSGREKWAC